MREPFQRTSGGMGIAVRILTGITIATFFGFFLVEAILWTIPWVNRILVPQLNPGLTLAVPVQAEVLRSLFLNQGAYNLLLAVGGVYGVCQLGGRNHRRGDAIVVFLLLFGVCAALTLLLTTHAYLLGLAQLLPPASALVLMRVGSRRAV